ncbi:MAG TPA: L-rhamnonate dehydratase [Pyrinomonadaceae bacterium]|nr:L-rhamnonate dehydratase [Pyrinomonadaceae bacterium]
MKQVTISEVRAYVMAADEMGADYHNQTGSHWIIDLPIANPMSVYEEYKAKRTSWGINALGTVLVEVELNDGTVGIGCSIGGEPACYIIEKHLSRFVEGQDPRNVELIWDQMWRATLPYGRKGLAVQAISAVDLAIWDCLGKLRGEPVYALLGGATKDKLPVYATTSRPDIAHEWGFQGAKIPCRYGPADGDEGLRKNIAVMREAREQVGPGFPLRLDCYMALTVPYAIKLAKALAEFDLDWIEECLPPDDYDGYAELKRALTGICLVTTGEHEYTRYGFRELISRKCADILQPDINWVGGLTEARRIVAMASAYDLPVIPHGSSVFSYHLQYAFTNCPLAEFLVMSPAADRVVPLFGELFRDEPLPRDGYVKLTDAPGWGVELNDKLDLIRPFESGQREVVIT